MGKGGHRSEDALLPCLSDGHVSSVCKQLPLLCFLAGHQGSISGHGRPHRRGHPHVCRLLLWVWFGEETATETPRGCAQVSTYFPAQSTRCCSAGGVTQVTGKNCQTGNGCPLLHMREVFGFPLPCAPIGEKIKPKALPQPPLLGCRHFSCEVVLLTADVSDPSPQCWAVRMLKCVSETTTVPGAAAETAAACFSSPGRRRDGFSFCLTSSS